MAAAAKLNQRYEQIEVLGEGGMGVVYRAYDSELRREVTLKTVRDIQDKAGLELFKREVNVLAGMTHPNIVEIYDIGEINETGGKRPYFVMPLLRGVTLDKLIKDSSQRLTVARCVDIISQVCRGLQAAHDAGLVHRDLKPSNIFVLEDDSVKIIDFGVAHLIDAHSTAGLKGTLLYMAPEQILLKRPSPLSDVFAVAVVCFVAMARRHPFDGISREEIADAIVNRIPLPASDFNPSVSPALSQVIHKGMAKQPFQRFSSARELAEYLQKAFRNEPIEWFNPAKIEARVERARKEFESGQLGIASEILSELEAEACLHKDIASLRKRIDLAHKQHTISQLLDIARRCFEGQEYQLALQKVQEVISLDSTNTEARALQGEIENKRSSEQIDDWCRIALQHMENHAYGHARDALQNVLKLKPKEAKAQQLISEVDRREQEYMRLRQEKDEAYEAALRAMEKGELSSALTKLERVLDMDRRAPDTFAPDRAAMYQKLYNEARSQHDLLGRSYAEARRHVENGSFAAALGICAEYLAKYPEHAMFRSLRLDAEDRQRQEVSAFVARISKEVDAEPDLARRIRLLEDALERYPDEPHFSRSLQSTLAKRDLVEAIVAKARAFEASGQYSEALDQWKILRDIYRQYPGLDFESDRLQKRKEQKDRSDAKGRWVEQIDRALNIREYARATDLCATALLEFPGDSELVALERSAQQGVQRISESQRLLEEAQACLRDGDRAHAIALLQQANGLEPSIVAVRSALLDALLSDAREKLENDWRAAEEPVQQVLELDPGNPRGKSLRTLIQDKKQEEYISDILSRARELKDAGNSEGALALIDEGLGRYPKDNQLLQRRGVIESGIKAASKHQALKRDWQRAQELSLKFEGEADPLTLRSIFDETRVLATKHPSDANFKTLVIDLQTKLQERERPSNPIVEPSPAAAARVRPTPRIPHIDPAAVRERAQDWYSKAVAWMSHTLARTRVKAAESWAALPTRSELLQGKKLPVRQLAMIGGALAVTALMAVIVSVIQFRASRPVSPPIADGRLAPEFDPTDAEYSILDSQGRDVTADREKLPVGDYLIRASAPGYDMKEERVRLALPATTLLVALKPLSQAFEVLTSTPGITVTKDGQTVTAAGPDGRIAVNELSESEHTVIVTIPNAGQASLVFTCRKGAMPEVLSFTSDRARVIAVSSFNGRARIYRPHKLAERVAVSLNGEAPKEVTEGGLDQNGFAAKEQMLVVSFAQDRVEQPLILTPGPKLALVVADVNAGTLLVDAGIPDVIVELDGKVRRGVKLQGDRLRFSVPPKDYLVRLSKEGYYSQEQKFTVRKGETQTYKVGLREIAKFGTLTIRRGAGTEVSVGDSGWQAVRDDGFSIQTPLKDLTVQIRKQGFRSWQATRSFRPDQEVVIDVAAEIKFEPKEGSVDFRLDAPDAVIRVSDSSGKEIPNPTRRMKLREGRYQVTGTAPGYESATAEFTVEDGKEVPVSLSLTKRPAPPPPKLPLVSEQPMDGWGSKNWIIGVDGWYNRIGRGPAFYDGARNGVFTFAVKRRGSKFRVYVRYKEPRDYVAFDVHKDKVVLVEWVDGQKIRETEKPLVLKVDSTVHAKITIGDEMALIELASRIDWLSAHSFTFKPGDRETAKLGLDDVSAIASFKRAAQ